MKYANLSVIACSSRCPSNMKYSLAYKSMSSKNIYKEKSCDFEKTTIRVRRGVEVKGLLTYLVQVTTRVKKNVLK